MSTHDADVPDSTHATDAGSRPAAVVSVVIPTVGRATLERAVSSALAQGLDVEVLVVNDSGSPLRSVPGARIVDTAGRTGAANARNLGMAAATAPLIAFLDDDDLWLPGHLASAVALLQARPDVDVYCSRALVVDESGAGRVEPVELLGARTALDYYNGPTMWRARNRRILTPTIVFRASLADHAMDPTLHNREDLWWLFTAQHGRGSRVEQSPHVGAWVEADRARLADRAAATDEQEWLERLDSLEPGTGNGYLVGTVGRLAARAGRPGEVLAIARQVADTGAGRRWVVPLAAEAAVASVLAVARRVRS